MVLIRTCRKPGQTLSLTLVACDGRVWSPQAKDYTPSAPDSVIPLHNPQDASVNGFYFARVADVPPPVALGDVQAVLHGLTDGSDPVIDLLPAPKPLAAFSASVSG